MTRYQYSLSLHVARPISSSARGTPTPGCRPVSRPPSGRTTTRPPPRPPETPAPAPGRLARTWRRADERPAVVRAGLSRRRRQVWGTWRPRLLLRAGRCCDHAAARRRRHLHDRALDSTTGGAGLRAGPSSCVTAGAAHRGPDNPGPAPAPAAERRPRRD